MTKPRAATIARFPVLHDFFAVDWKDVPPRHAYGVYALSLYANLPDYAEVASESLTEGSDDKDCDLCLIDTEAGAAFIVQATVGNDWGKPTASANKADDLLTALSWLLKKPYDQIPAVLRSKAIELQEALARKEITHLHLLFVHNCQQSPAVEQALDTVAAAAKTLVGDPDVAVVALEIGLPRLQHLYNSLTKQIVVEKKITFPVRSVLEESGDGWKAVQMTLEGALLHDLWNEHRDDLFSANIRGFLDMLSRKTSVNRGILETVTSVPGRFWAFNNGVTILTKNFTRKKGAVVANGVSVINGAQTTGVLGNAPRERAAECRVPCRLIECNDPDVVNDIIANNNTQNAIRAFDIRSNDAVQRRLQTEFSAVSLVYLHRRQGAHRLDASAIQAETLAPYLAAFHGRFQIAIRQRRTIFEDGATYASVFPPQMSARHVLLVHSLSVAVNNYKLELVAGHKQSGLNKPQLAVHDFLKFSTAKLFVIGVAGRIAEQIAGRSLPDLFAWKVADSHFKSTWQTTLVNRWQVLVAALVPLVVSDLDGEAKDVVRSPTDLDKVATKVDFQLLSLKSQYDSVMSPIRDVCSA
ncbi:MAG: AIPR family protein [Chloroflexi bacterium]|nr:AIPR family protein [Chloroflexota bacterium]